MSKSNEIKAEKVALLLESHRGIARLAFRHIRGVLKKYDVSVAGASILKVIHEQGPSSQHALAESLCITDAAISRQIRLLVKDGLIEVRSDTSNQRISVIDLALKGRQLADEMKLSIERHFVAVLDEMAEKEIDTLTTFSQKMLEKLSERRDKEKI